MLSRVKFWYKRLFWTPEKYARSIGVKIGNNCSIATWDFGSEPYLLEIGNHVQITNGVKFFQHGGAWVYREKYPDIDFFGKIKIGNNVYIGNCAMILPGITIENNVIIGAGSVVTKSVPENSIIGGNPARIISKVDEYLKKMSDKKVNTKQLDYLNKKNFILSLDERSFIKKQFL